MNLEQIANQVGAEVWPDSVRNVRECEEFARRLVAALSAQKPVAWVSDCKTAQFWKEVTPGTKLFAAPPICPTAEWQDIETAPKDQTEIIVFAPDENPQVFTAKFIYGWVYSRANEYAPFDETFGETINPTHWMPLPAAPEYKKP